MDFRPLPRVAAWQHVEARTGFEVVFMETTRDGFRFEGTTTAVEDGEPWCVRYVIEVSAAWATQKAVVSVRSAKASRAVAIEADGEGRWRVDGKREARLDGCMDIDLESSAVTNTFPVHRLGLGEGESADAPAVYVRAVDLAVERLEQRYQRLPDAGAGHRYAYLAPRFGADLVLPYDASGLVTDYPGLARRSL